MDTVLAGTKTSIADFRSPVRPGFLNNLGVQSDFELLNESSLKMLMETYFGVSKLPNWFVQYWSGRPRGFGEYFVNQLFTMKLRDSELSVEVRGSVKL